MVFKEIYNTIVSLNMGFQFGMHWFNDLGYIFMYTLGRVYKMIISEELSQKPVLHL